MNKSTEMLPVGDFPNTDPRPWLLMSVVLAILFGVPGVIFALMFIFGGNVPSGAAERAGMLTPLFGLAVGLVTFCTVIWRGLITDKQREQQERQNNLNERAHRATESANYASLLERGAKLLGEDGREQDRMAGVALLEAVIAEPEHRYSVQAMNLLASYFFTNIHKLRGEQVFDSVRQAMNHGVRQYGIWSTIEGKIDDADPQHSLEGHSRRKFPEVIGFRKLHLINAYIVGADEDSLFKNNINVITDSSGSHIFVERCRIVDSNIPTNVHFRECEFRNCDFSAHDCITVVTSKNRSVLMNCNISNLEFQGFDIVRSMNEVFKNSSKQNRNYFIEGNPPKLIEMFGYGSRDYEVMDVDISRYFDIRTN